MNSLEGLSTRIVSHISVKDEKFGVDPATITLIISIIINLLRLWWSVSSKKSAARQLKKPSLLFKLLLKREIRKRVKSQNRQCVYGAFMDVAPSVSEIELVNITKEIESRK